MALDVGFYQQALVMGVGVARTAAAFTIMPLISPDTVPATVRNSLFVCFSLLVIALQPEAAHLSLDPPHWMGLYLREVMIGLVIGLFFSTLLYAFEAAGQIIDAKTGATIAQIVDPLSGAQTSLNGAFLGRLGSYVFMASGGLLLLVTAILDSYAIWPIAASAPILKPEGAGIIEGEFARLMGTAVVIAAPALVMLTVVEAGMGLVNRFAPQLNVFSLSLSIKAWLATLVVLAMSGLLVNMLTTELFTRPAVVAHFLKTFADPPPMLR